MMKFGESIGVPRAENVGSLLRPARLKQAIERHLALPEDQRGENRARLGALEDDLIREAVARQEAAGLDVVSDGEFRRLVFVNSFYEAIRGVEPGPQFTFRNDAGEEVQTPPLYAVSDRLERVDSPAAREAAFVSSVATKPFKITFPAASWFASPFLMRPDEAVPGYESADEALDDMVRILRELIRDAIEAGARYVQLDYPSYVYLLDDDAVAQIRAMGLDRQRLLDTWIRLDQAVLEGMPDDVRFAMHICRGNYKSYWMFQGSLEPVAESVFSELPYHSFLVEWEDTRREGDYSPLRHVPKGPVVAMGIVSSKVNRLESDDEVLRRLDEASRYLDADQLALCTQCGFASSVPGNEVDEATQWRKLELVGRVAERVWPERAG
jgi:5-methyltetrahydropteroyltriglutamate--homocysteine methyltransferase